MIGLAWPVAVVIVAVLASRVAHAALRFRGDLKIVKDSAAALLKHEARLNAVERALEAAMQERVA